MAITYRYLAPAFLTCIIFSSTMVRAQSPVQLSFEIDRTIAQRGFDGETCWVHARAGAVPAGVHPLAVDKPLVVMTMQKLLLSGSDVFYEINETHTVDGGQSWSPLLPQPAFRRQRVVSLDADRLPTGSHIAPHLLLAGDETTVCDFVPKWHAASQRLLGIGQTVWYRNNRVTRVRPRGIAYSVFDVANSSWSAWQVANLPAEARFQNAGSGSVQRVDLLGGDILLPFYFKLPGEEQYSVAVGQFRFDGQRMEYVRGGEPLTVPVKRGLYEPSLTKYRDRFYLTLRNDDHGYVASSHDGLHFEDMKKWQFDDGSDLGNYNTQQHWVTHSHGLFLVYTRRGADNDHVFRHRAPLFIAQVNTDTLQVQRATERIVVPERGARLGNFGVVDVSPQETWITVSEWMQPRGVEEHGSDNSVFVARLKWNLPNAGFNSSEATAALPPDAPNDPVAGQAPSAAKGEAWERIEPYFTPPVVWQDASGDYRSPLLFEDGRRVTSAEDWSLRRQELLEKWQQWLGAWPALITNPSVELLDTEEQSGFTQHKIRFQWTPAETTTGYLLIPNGAGPHPAVVTVYYEPETAIGLGGVHRDFALQLARRGFVTLSIGTSEATAAKTYGLYHPSLEDAQVQPLSMLAYAAANAWYVLAARPEVDAQRIGIVGHSFGGKWAMFAACLFDKFACAAWSDPGIVFDESRPSVNYWEPWYLGYHPPPWRERGVITPENPARGLYTQLRATGADLHELHALMAPRPFLVSGGSEDPLSRWTALNHSREVNRVLGYEHRVAMTNRPEHAPNADSNEVIYQFFAHFLQ